MVFNRHAVTVNDRLKKFHIGLLGRLQTGTVDVIREATGAPSRIERELGVYLANTSENAATSVAPLLGKGKRYKKLIDARATEAYKEGFKRMVGLFDHLVLRVIQGEGGKDDSVGLYTGRHFVSGLVLDDENPNTLMVDVNIDPVDGTNWAAFDEPDGRHNSLATSVTSYGVMPRRKETAFLRVPDSASIFVMATPLDIPNPQLDMP